MSSATCWPLCYDLNVLVQLLSPGTESERDNVFVILPGLISSK